MLPLTAAAAAVFDCEGELGFLTSVIDRSRIARMVKFNLFDQEIFKSQVIKV
jgi:hypothetical protein